MTASPDPAATVSFVFGDYARDTSKAREVQKSELWAGLLHLLRSIDLVERCGFCSRTLTGLVVLIGELLDQPGTLARAHEVGVAKVGGYTPVVPEPRVVEIQITTAHEPDGALRGRLLADGFARMTAPGVQPIIWIGRGVIAEWRIFQGTDVRIVRIDLPGGLVTGAPIAGGSRAVPGDTTLVARSGGEIGVVLPASSEARGADDGTEQEVPSPLGEATEEVHAASPRRPYRMARVARPNQPGWQLHTATDAEREQLMRAVVTQQGPVDLDTAIEAVRISLDLGAIRKTTRGKLRAALDRLVNDSHVIVLPGGFYHLHGAPILPRDRRGCDERVRALSALPPAEIDAALREDLAEAGPRLQPEVIVGAAARLGHRMRSPASRPALAKLLMERIDTLVDNADLTRVDGRLALSQSLATAAGAATMTNGETDAGHGLDDPRNTRQEDDGPPERRAA